jgi:hypothetical protein
MTQSGHRVATEQHRPKICGITGGRRNFHHFAVYEGLSSSGGESAMTKRLTSLFAITTFILAAASGSAFAADLNKPVYKAPPPAPVPAPVYNWTGWRMGAQQR